MRFATGTCLLFAGAAVLPAAVTGLELTLEEPSSRRGLRFNFGSGFFDRFSRSTDDSKSRGTVFARFVDDDDDDDDDGEPAFTRECGGFKEVPCEDTGCDGNLFIGDGGLCSTPCGDPIWRCCDKEPRCASADLICLPVAGVDENGIPFEESCIPCGGLDEVACVGARVSATHTGSFCCIPAARASATHTGSFCRVPAACASATRDGSFCRVPAARALCSLGVCVAASPCTRQLQLAAPVHVASDVLVQVRQL